MMNGKVRAFNGDMGMAMSVFKDMVGKVRFVFADPPYKITQARYDKEGFDYKAMWEVIQKMLCPYGVVAVTCSLTAAVEIMRVAQRDGTGTTLFGIRLPLPVFLTPRKLH